MVDEFGAAEGIVTVEDIVEEVIEDLHEYEPEEAAQELYRELGERDYFVNGRAELAGLSDDLGLELPSGSYPTLAGFALHKTGSIPPPGARVDEGPYVLTVNRRTARAIEEVHVCWVA